MKNVEIRHRRIKRHLVTCYLIRNVVVPNILTLSCHCATHLHPTRHRTETQNNCVAHTDVIAGYKTYSSTMEVLCVMTQAINECVNFKTFLGLGNYILVSMVLIRFQNCYTCSEVRKKMLVLRCWISYPL